MEGNPDAKPLRAVHADVRKSNITAVAKDSVYILLALISLNRICTYPMLICDGQNA